MGRLKLKLGAWSLAGGEAYSEQAQGDRPYELETRNYFWSHLDDDDP